MAELSPGKSLRRGWRLVKTGGRVQLRSSGPYTLKTTVPVGVLRPPKSATVAVSLMGWPRAALGVAAVKKPAGTVPAEEGPDGRRMEVTRNAPTTRTTRCRSLSARTPLPQRVADMAEHISSSPHPRPGRAMSYFVRRVATESASLRDVLVRNPRSTDGSDEDLALRASSPDRGAVAPNRPGR